ncbi:HupE/UreJ family protein [Thermus igniterrae]|uniref:HupE/UreJ family protein n=1 Tax=Thermus igniterrae TaxID=88189 RepID=UPI00037E22E0|nr:HupE/UreJ family protein [Thermus igniterrae]
MRKMGLPGVAFWLLVPALAHPEGHAGGFGYGLVHPLHGLDHLAAMVAVGLWAGQLGGRFLLGLPLAFVGAAAAGWALGLGLGAWSGVEMGILASLAVLGALVALAHRPKGGWAFPLVALFGLFHGFAHGAETPLQMPGAFAAGFLLSTLFLHLAGVGMARLSPRLGTSGQGMVRALGMGTVLLAVALLALA